MFPTHSFICGDPPQYQHRLPQIDFLFVELRILFNHSDSAAVNNITLNTPTQWLAMWVLVFSETNEEEELPVVSVVESKQDFV